MISLPPGFFGQDKVLHISRDMGTGCNGHVDCVPNQLMRYLIKFLRAKSKAIFCLKHLWNSFFSHETVGICWDWCIFLTFFINQHLFAFKQCWIHPGWLFYTLYRLPHGGRHLKGSQWTAKHKCLKRGAHLFVCLIVTMGHEIPWMYMGCLSMYIIYMND